MPSLEGQGGSACRKWQRPSDGAILHHPPKVWEYTDLRPLETVPNQRHATVFESVPSSRKLGFSSKYLISFTTRTLLRLRSLDRAPDCQLVKDNTQILKPHWEQTVRTPNTDTPTFFSGFNY